MPNELAEKLSTLSTADLCSMYVTLRDRKKAEEDALNKRLSKLKATMEVLENLLLNKLQEQNIDSVATPHGTAYRSQKVGYSVKDGVAFLGWAQQHGAEHTLDIRAAKAAVDEIVQETGVVPEGLQRSAIFKVGIRRSTNA